MGAPGHDGLRRHGAPQYRREGAPLSALPRELDRPRGVGRPEPYGRLPESAEFWRLLSGVLLAVGLNAFGGDLAGQGCCFFSRVQLVRHGTPSCLGELACMRK